MKISEYNTLSRLDRQLMTLMLRFGYTIKNGDEIWSTPIAWYKGQFVRHCRSIFDAAEQLCPIINEPEYTDRLVRLTGETK